MGKSYLLDCVVEAVREMRYQVARSDLLERDSALAFQFLRGLSSSSAPLPRSDSGDEAWWSRDQGGSSEPLTPTGEAERLLRARAFLHSLLRGMARRDTVVVVDDAHWADPDSAALLEDLLRRPPEIPLALILARRPRQTQLGLKVELARAVRLGTATRVELRPLDTKETVSLIGEEHARQLGPNGIEELHRRGEGNPLYLRALRVAVRDGVRDYDLPEQEAPQLLGDIHLLPPDAALLLDAAAVMGTEVFDPGALSAAVGLSAERGDRALRHLCARDLLRPDETGTAYYFRHEVLRHVVRGAVSSVRKAALHRKLADSLAEQRVAATELARHIEGAQAVPSASDVSVLLKAAEEVIACSPEDAIRWLRHGLKSAPAGETRGNVILMLASALANSGRLTESCDLLHEALMTETSLPDFQRVQAASVCALSECFMGRYAEAQNLLRAGTTPASRKARMAQVELTISRALVALFDGHPPTDEEIVAAWQTATAEDDRLSVAGVLALRAFCGSLEGDVAMARESARESALTIDAEPDERMAHKGAYLAILGWSETFLGEFDAAERHFIRGRALTRRFGQRLVLVLQLLGLSTVYRRTGLIPKARSVIEDARENAHRIRAENVESIALALELQGMMWLEFENKEQDLVPLAERTVRNLHKGGSWLGLSAKLSLATAAWSSGDPRRCSMLILDAGGGPELPQFPPILRPACFEMLAAVNVEIGYTDVDEWARRATACAQSLGLPYLDAIAMVARGHAAVAREQGEQALALYREAADGFSRVGMIGFRSRALTLAADVAATLGEHALVESLLFLAMDLANQCGNEATVASIGERLERTRGRRTEEDRETREILAGLTNREREIAALARTGRRTRSIAQELSVSPRTVDVHLARIYRKLNISSRTQLAWLLNGRELGAPPR